MPQAPPGGAAASSNFTGKSSDFRRDLKKQKKKEAKEKRKLGIDAASTSSSTTTPAAAAAAASETTTTSTPSFVGVEDLTVQEIETAVRVVKILSKTENQDAFFKPAFRALRVALAPLVNAQMDAFRGENDGATDLKRKGKRELAEMDKQYINSVQLREKRLRMLESLNNGDGVLRIADGVGEEDTERDGGAGIPQKTFMITDATEEAEEKKNGDDDDETMKEADGSAGAAAAAASTKKNTGGPIFPHELNRPIRCYICKKPFTLIHFFYDQLCPTCAELNYEKRNQTANLEGMYALVTGARVKIGYRIALKLLRCGATVIATTRFPKDGAVRFAAEPDFEIWRNRLRIYGVDFRAIQGVEKFCFFLSERIPKLDVIINNACQTVRRPVGFYSHLMAKERLPLLEMPEKTRDVLGGQTEDFSSTKRIDNDQDEPRRRKTTKEGEEPIPFIIEEEDEEIDEEIEVVEGKDGKTVTFATTTKTKTTFHTSSEGGAAASSSSSEGTVTQTASSSSSGAAGAAVDFHGPTTSAELSQVKIVKDDENTSQEVFPEKALDAHGQQVDLRRKNSWTMRMHEIETAEVAEVMAINVIAPFTINARLKHLMEKGDPEQFKFIVNVSAMEGKFYRPKNDKHSHTNMGKAALNMMTRTSAQDYVKSNIYMTSVDTGWINDEKPVEKAAAHAEKHNFQTPLDEVDAAARVLDPVFDPLRRAQQGEKGVVPAYGYFIKDYAKCEW